MPDTLHISRPADTVIRASNLYDWREDVVWISGSENLSAGELSADSLDQAFQPASSAAEVWGERSVVSVEVMPKGSQVLLADDTEPWQIAVPMVVLVCFYSYILYRFRRDILSSLRNISETEDTLTLMEGQGADFNYYLRSGMILLVLGCSILLMTWVESFLTDVPNYYLLVAAILALTGILLYQRFALRVMCWFSEAKGMFREVRFIERMDITLIALVYTPLAIIIGLSERFFIPGILFLGLLFGLHFISLYKYFRIRAFSRLQYILYLCTIEILPVSFIIALAVRSQISGIY